MKEKPPVLSEAMINSIRFGVISTADKLPKLPSYVSVLLHEQVAADVVWARAYYEPIIQQVRKPKTRIIDITRAKKKVRQDIAREIFEDVERLWPIPQSLKDKWLKGSNENKTA